MFHKILIAIDDSDSHRSVFESALTLAKATNAHLMLLHVISLADPNTLALPLFSGYYPTVNQELIKRFQAEQQALENRGLKRLQALASEATIAGVTTEVTQVVGDPGSLICAIAKDRGAGLIVIGRRGHSGLGELFLGSVSNYVLHHAPCSVLVIQQAAVKSQMPFENEVETGQTECSTP